MGGARATKGYVLVARVLQAVGGLSALVAGVKGFPTAALIFGIGTLIDLMAQILDELRTQQVMILSLLPDRKEEERDEPA